LPVRSRRCWSRRAALQWVATKDRPDVRMPDRHAGLEGEQHLLLLLCEVLDASPPELRAEHSEVHITSVIDVAIDFDPLWSRCHWFWIRVAEASAQPPST